MHNYLAELSHGNLWRFPCVNNTEYTNNKSKETMKKKPNVNIVTVIGVIVLIVLLLLWLTDAFSVGDTDVNAPLSFLGFVGNIA